MRKTNYQLNIKQLRLLKLLYKFRYTTAPLLAEYLNVQSDTARRNLELLYAQNYLGKVYESSWKIDRKPAIYYLEKKGLKLLKSDEALSAKVLHSYYKNKTLSEETRLHYLDVFAVYNALQSVYENQLEIFTKSELADFDEMPANRPDLYLRQLSGEKEFFLTLAHDMQPFVARKRLNEYVDYSEEAGWTSSTRLTLLFVCRTKEQEQKLLSHSARVLDSTGITNAELSIGATTFQTLLRKPYDFTTLSDVGEA